jgi:hypothetical protein
MDRISRLKSWRNPLPWYSLLADCKGWVVLVVQIPLVERFGRRALPTTGKVWSRSTHRRVCFLPKQRCAATQHKDLQNAANSDAPFSRPSHGSIPAYDRFMKAASIDGIDFD